VEMRILIGLRALKDQGYDPRYHHKLQGFIYDLLRGTPYSDLHDRRGYKFFCFSNIFPPADMRRGDLRHLLISSPERPLLGVLEGKLSEILEGDGRVEVGDMAFSLESLRVLEPRLRGGCTLVSGTPIVVRIPRENYGRYGIRPPRDYDYVYWRPRYSFEAFVRQLEDNLFKKYREFRGERLEGFQIFEQFTFKKPVCNHVVFGGREVKVLGSLWEFPFSHLNKNQREILQFGLECGFGELNSLGFGFMNVVRADLRERRG